MEISLKVTIDLTERLEAALSGLVCCYASDKRLDAMKRVPREDATEAAQAAPAVEVAQSPAPQNPAPVSAQKAEPAKPQTEAEAFAQWQSPATVSDDVLRTYMDNTFKQIVGEDWETTTDPESITTKRKLTQIFKQQAGELGAAKPSALPQDKRQEFIRRLNSITRDDNGNLIVMPF